MKVPQMSYLSLALILCACSTTNVTNCPDKMCTTEFRMVQVKFTEEGGTSVAVEEYNAINKRTNSPMAQNNEPATINNRGIYTVASDADIANLSDMGDTILVTGTHPVSKKVLKSEFVVSGGECACHITKISGPESLQF